jgi:two-component system chemotaxis sensor kinase CheA
MLITDINAYNRFQAAFHNIDSLTQRISENIMKIRMQPISVITEKLKRVVRDLAASTGKEVELVVEGDKIEIDRTILEALKNPIIHIIRNAIDHGIEKPAERIDLGKNSCGQIKIIANHAENHIIIKIMDDGKGIDLNKIKEKAIEKKLIRNQDLNNMDERSILNLIFYPGFSTKDTVTNLSGRGIGMDVVKSNLAEVNGTIELKTRKDQGTELILRLPLTLALAAAVIVEIDALKYAISSNNIKELGCVFFKDIEGKDFFEIREEKYPVIFADTILNNYERKKVIKKNAQDTVEYLLVEINKLRFIVVVDKILDLKDMLIKALPEKVQDIDFYSGATILPDGKVALILDLEAVYRNYQTGASCINKSIKPNNLMVTKVNPKKLITFTLGDYYCGINKESIKEVIANRITTPVPGANNLSLVNIRDQVFLVRKLKKTIKLNLKDSKFTIHIVVNHGNESTGLEVDDINETIKFDEDWELAKETNEALAKFCL